MAINVLPDLGYAEAPCGTFDQPYTQRILQRRDPPADTGFGDAHCPCGGGKAAMRHHAREKPEIVEVFNSHCSTYRTQCPKIAIYRLHCSQYRSIAPEFNKRCEHES